MCQVRHCSEAATFSLINNTRPACRPGVLGTGEVGEASSRGPGLETQPPLLGESGLQVAVQGRRVKSPMPDRLALTWRFASFQKISRLLRVEHPSYIPSNQCIAEPTSFWPSAHRLSTVPSSETAACAQRPCKRLPSPRCFPNLGIHHCTVLYY